jgi:hypothetical protein
MKFCAVVVIAPDELEEAAIDRAREAGASGITILSGRGIGDDRRKTFLGMTFEGSQSVLLMVVARRLTQPILKAMRSVLIEDGDSRGIAFSVSIDHLAGIEMSQVMKFEQHLHELEKED